MDITCRTSHSAVRRRRCNIQRFRHFVHAVEAFEQRRGNDHLRLLCIFTLQVAAIADELLIGPAQFDIGVQVLPNRMRTSGYKRRAGK